MGKVPARKKGRAAKKKRKYGFTGETRHLAGRTLRRIYRLSDGLVGGWIEGEYNLSQEGDCFVYDEAMVYSGALIRDNARAAGHCRIAGSAVVQDSSCVDRRAWATGRASIRDRAVVTDRSWVGDEGTVCDEARLEDDSGVSDYAIVGKKAVLRHNAWAHGTSRVYTSTPITKDERLKNEIRF